MSSLIEKYNWTDELEPFCITIAVGAELALVETAFKIIPETRKLTTAAEYSDFAGDMSEGNDVVQINTLSNSVVVIENNGWTGCDLDHSIIKSIGCPVFVSVFRNINSVMQFTYAKNGVLVRQFDPLLYDAEGAIPEEASYSWNLEHPIVSAFALAETLTGIEMTRAWLLDQAHPTYRTRHGNG